MLPSKEDVKQYAEQCKDWYPPSEEFDDWGRFGLLMLNASLQEDKSAEDREFAWETVLELFPIPEIIIVNAPCDDQPFGTCPLPMEVKRRPPA